MTCGWTAAQLKGAIERCNAECLAALARHEAPAKIDGMRKGVGMLHKWLARAEREERERHGQMEMAHGA